MARFHARDNVVGTMYSLTLYQPWAWAFADGHKTVENRGYPPPPWLIGQRIAIHAGKVLQKDDVRFIAEERVAKVPSHFVQSAIVATAIVHGVVTKSRDPWFVPGIFGWLLKDVRKVEPIGVSGQLRLWRVSPSLDRALTLDSGERLSWLVKGKSALTDWEQVLDPGKKSVWWTRRAPRDLDAR